jgi:hypothetical protein
MLCSGCELVELAACNLSYEAWLCKEHTVACVRNRKAAEQALRESYCLNSSQRYSADYEKGFKAGYTDQLDANALLAPPAIPPKHYWSDRYQTPEGHVAIEDWFRGYQQGAHTARISGQREFLAVPFVGHGPAPGMLPPQNPMPETEGAASGVNSTPLASPFPIVTPTAEQLPPARPVGKE